MKFIFAFVFLIIFSSTVLCFETNGTRLPLPQVIQRLHPELLKESNNGRVVGGVAALEGDAPYQIALYRSDAFSCGGVFIGTQTVLTAAHCVYGNENNPSIFSIRYGTLDRTQGSAIAITKIIRHPSYSSSTTDYDVAVLTLAAPFTPGVNAQVIALADSTPSDGSALTLTGWGRLQANGLWPLYLQKATTLRVVSQSECSTAWGSDDAITGNMFCAISTTQSGCNGDSGGPIVQNGILVGTVSWGPSSCLHATFPNVYANVAVLKSWIQSNS